MGEIFDFFDIMDIEISNIVSKNLHNLSINDDSIFFYFLSGVSFSEALLYSCLVQFFYNVGGFYLVGKLEGIHIDKIFFIIQEIAVFGMQIIQNVVVDFHKSEDQLEKFILDFFYT